MADDSIYEHWDPYDKTFREDPFPTYARFRETTPVGHCPAYGGFWALTSYEDVFEAARDWRTYSSADGVTIPPFPFEAKALPMESDPPEHQAMRMILMPHFAQHVVREREGLVRDRARELLDGLAGREQVDLSEAFAKPLPTAVICELLDIEDLTGEFQDWAETIIYERDDPEAGKQAVENILSYFRELIPKRRATPGDDFISVLVKAEIEGNPLEDATVLDFCWFLLIAGLDNTAFTIRNLLLQMAQMDWLREALIEDPSRIPDAVEETLRLYSPVWGIARTCTRDTTLAGRNLADGDRIMLLFASADRDPDQFPDPNEFKLGRAPNNHVAFGTGRHRCLGSHLARLEIRVAVEEFLARYPNYALTEPVGWNEMGPLPVTLNPSQQ
ncbi:MAG: cytochrome P450 [Pseudomonadales bacterium]|jgi:cytochrome P450|nr:cytochrome P450 [Kiritimatiellia bacterium]MDP6971967.1 cytochrome P450 [Pseudomonadales bacterium]